MVVRAANDRIRLDRLRLPLHLDQAAGLDVEEVLDQPVRLGGDLHGPGFGRLLHAGGDVDRISHRRVLETQVRTHLTDHHRARVDADPDVEVQAVLGSHLLLVGRDPGDDVEAGPDRALRVVLVCDRRAEEREDRVAHQAGERSFVAVDRGDQPFEGAVHDLRPDLGIQRLRHRRGALDVAEQHGDDAALALHRATGSGCLELGEQFPRKEGVERGALGGWIERSSARVAESGAVGVRGSTRRAVHEGTIARAGSRRLCVLGAPSASLQQRCSEVKRHSSAYCTGGYVRNVHRLCSVPSIAVTRPADVRVQSIRQFPLTRRAMYGRDAFRSGS